MNRRDLRSSRSSLRCSAALAWIILAAMGAPLAAQSRQAAPGTARMLFIGNSYTYYNDLPGTLQAMRRASAGASVTLGSIVEGGASLRTHWTPEVLERIRGGSWDYVVLQEQSLAPIQTPDEFIAYGIRFGKEIRAANARPVLFLTWAREGRPSDQGVLDQAYRRLAAEIDATIVPVGPAWLALQRLDGTVRLHDDDGSHPSPLGSFVAAVTFHRTLFGVLPSRAYTGDPGITPRMVDLVHRAVEATVRQYSLPR